MVLGSVAVSLIRRYRELRERELGVNEALLPLWFWEHPDYDPWEYTPHEPRTGLRQAALVCAKNLSRKIPWLSIYPSGGRLAIGLTDHLVFLVRWEHPSRESRPINRLSCPKCGTVVRGVA